MAEVPAETALRGQHLQDVVLEQPREPLRVQRVEGMKLLVQGSVGVPAFLPVMFQALEERSFLGTSRPVDRRSCHHLNRTSEQHKSANDHWARSGANAFNESVRRGRRPTVIRRRSRSPHLQPERSLPSR
jgi:hypothetical protein